VRCVVTSSGAHGNSHSRPHGDSHGGADGGACAISDQFTGVKIVQTDTGSGLLPLQEPTGAPTFEPTATPTAAPTEVSTRS
jgi:hypothetical protein